MSFSTAGAITGNCGSVSVKTNSNAHYLKTAPMTKDAIHPMSLQATIGLLGIKSESLFDIEMQPFIFEPSPPADIFYLVTARPGKSETLTFTKHVG